MVLAGCSAKLNGFAFEAASVSISMTWLANRGSMDAQEDPQPRADAMQGEPAVGAGGHRAGPAGQVIGMGPPECGAFEVLRERHSAPCGRTRRMAVTDNFTSAGGLALQVEQPPLDHLLGPKRDVGGGLLGVGVELDPAGAIARRQGDGAEFDRDATTRCAGRRAGTGPSRRWSPGRSPSGSRSARSIRTRERSWTARRPSPTRSAPACPAGRARGRRRTCGPGRAVSSGLPPSRRPSVGQALSSALRRPVVRRAAMRNALPAARWHERRAWSPGGSSQLWIQHETSAPPGPGCPPGEQ